MLRAAAERCRFASIRRRPRNPCGAAARARKQFWSELRCRFTSIRALARGAPESRNEAPRACRRRKPVALALASSRPRRRSGRTGSARSKSASRRTADIGRARRDGSTTRARWIASYIGMSTCSPPPNSLQRHPRPISRRSSSGSTTSGAGESSAVTPSAVPSRSSSTRSRSPRATWTCSRIGPPTVSRRASARERPRTVGRGAPCRYPQGAWAACGSETRAPPRARVTPFRRKVQDAVAERRFADGCGPGFRMLNRPTRATGRRVPRLRARPPARRASDPRQGRGGAPGSAPARSAAHARRARPRARAATPP